MINKKQTCIYWYFLMLPLIKKMFSIFCAVCKYKICNRLENTINYRTSCLNTHYANSYAIC